jgi:hypothetical protein
LAIDACYLGKTFTNLVFYTTAGELHCFRVPSTPGRPGAGVLAGIDEIKASLGFDDAARRQLVHTHI